MWGVPIALYLFLGGLCSGTFFFTALLQLAHGNRYLSTLRWGAWLACAFLAAGLVCLLYDTSQPWRALNMLTSFSNVEGSWMARGAWILLASFATMLAYALGTCGPSTGNSAWGAIVRYRALFLNVVGLAGMVLALCLAGYTGFLLFAAKYIPAWNTLLVPLLFFVSALENGIALVRVLFRPQEWKGGYSIRAARTMRWSATAAFAVEVAVIVSFVLYLNGIGAFALLDVGVRTEFHVLSVAFLALIATNLVLVAVDAVRTPRSFAYLVILGTCALSKGFLLRALVLLLGVHVPFC